jgi:hypothetical protein
MVDTNQELDLSHLDFGTEIEQVKERERNFTKYSKLRDEKTWTSKDGKEYKISELGDMHLSNIYTFLERIADGLAREKEATKSLQDLMARELEYRIVNDIRLGESVTTSEDKDSVSPTNHLTAEESESIIEKIKNKLNV